MANITLMGASYTDVPAVTLPQTGGGTVTFYENGGVTPAISVVDTTATTGGTIRTITALDISDTTAVASDVASGKYFYTANGVKTQGSASGGGGSPSATQHTIHLEFSDSTDTDIDVYYDDSLIGTMITSYDPTTYGGKTVTLAQLDGVTWYEPANIPMNTELIDYTKVSNNTAINAYGEAESQQWYYTTDYTAVDPSMTFTYKASTWFYIGVYDASKNVLRAIYVYTDGTQGANDISTGVLSGSKLTGAAYVRITSNGTNSSYMSLIRTA